MKLPPLTKKAIRAYVETLPADEPVGVTKDPQRCLVARYLKDALQPQYPRLSVAVCREGVYVTAYATGTAWTILDFDERDTPPRVLRIIERFDALTKNYPLPADVLPIFEEARP